MKRVAGAPFAGWVVAIALATDGCSAHTVASQAPPSCDEFPASLGVLSLDANTTALLNASAKLVDLATNTEAALLDACVGIATDLMVGDTWTAKGPANGGTTDAEVTEACDEASRAVAAVLAAKPSDAGGPIVTPCVLSVSGGACSVDPSSQAKCIATCSGGAACAPPTVAADCQSAEVSGLCTGNCMAGATCRGSAAAPAQCVGSCSAECSGECDGTTSSPVQCNGTCSGHCTGTCNGGAMSAGTCAGACIGTCDGRCVLAGAATVPCSGDCKGSCTGDCKLDSTVMLACGATVPCSGGCTAAYTLPSCDGKLAEPACDANANCQASCQGGAMLSASCTSPVVSLVCTTAPVGGSLQVLATTLQANLPVVLEVAQTQKQLALDAATMLVAAGQSVISAGGISGKTSACVTAAEAAASSAQTSLRTSVAASVAVGASANGGTSS
jgi:hypothetical protein